MVLIVPFYFITIRVKCPKIAIIIKNSRANSIIPIVAVILRCKYLYKKTVFNNSITDITDILPIFIIEVYRFNTNCLKHIPLKSIN